MWTAISKVVLYISLIIKYTHCLSACVYNESATVCWFVCTYICIHNVHFLLFILIIMVPLFTWQLVTYACLCACLCHVCVTINLFASINLPIIMICLPVAITYFQSCTARMINNVAELWVIKLSYGVKMGRKVESFRWRWEVWVHFRVQQGQKNTWLLLSIIMLYCYYGLAVAYM